MDSLTQMVLGAAVGEALLGKKIGNRAMVWGAIGGTIPDLDILAYTFMHPMDALAAHRGISHSLFFGVLFPFVVAFIPHWIYGYSWHKKSWYRWTISVVSIIFLTLFSYLIVSILSSVFGFSQWIKWLVVLLFLVLIVYRVLTKYTFSEAQNIDVGYRNWVKLFMGAIITHPLLDAFTPYGTQLFQPFSDFRVAFNTISIVDPIYTIPFLLCLLIAGRYKRRSPRRSKWNRAGLILSTTYLIWSVGIHQYVVGIVRKDHLKTSDNAVAIRFMTTPTLLNTILWNVVTEYDDYYTLGYYSLFDNNPKVSNLIRVQKQHQLLQNFEQDHAYRILRWFSNGYYSIEKIEDSYRFHDLRYTSRKEDWSQLRFIFGYALKPNGDRLEVKELRDRPKDGKNMFGNLWRRLKGI